MAASVRIEDEAFSDERYDDLAQVAGLADGDHARGKMARLWRQCTLETRYVLPVQTVLRILGERGVEALVAARLGEVVADGIRIRGTKGRVEWLKKLRSNGKFGKKGGRPKRNPGGFPQEPLRVSDSAENETPPTSAPAPTSAPVQEERESAATTSPHQPVKFAWNTTQVWWQEMLDADERIRAERIDVNAERYSPKPSLSQGDNMLRIARDLASSGLNADEVSRKMFHIVRVAEAEAKRVRHRNWFKPSMIWDLKRATRSAETSLAEASSERPQPSNGYQKPEPPRRRNNILAGSAT